MISVIIPVHNGERFIKRAIDSVIAQHGDWELIVVNDHSTDCTAQILAWYASDRKLPITVINSTDFGVTEARMCGAKQAAGDYLFFMDADDELPPDTIEVMTSKIAIEPDVAIVIGDIVEVRDKVETTISYGDHDFNKSTQLFDWIIDNRMGYLWGKAIRKELFLSLPYVPSNLKFCEDYVQMLQLTLFAKKVTHVGTESYIYYQNPQSACNSIKSKSDFYTQFYDLSAALCDLIDMMLSRNILQNKINRIKVMFLFYARLYLAVAGGWRKDIANLRYKYKAWMTDNSLMTDKLYDKKRKRQTLLAYMAPWFIAMAYVPLLRYKYHRIK